MLIADKESVTLGQAMGGRTIHEVKHIYNILCCRYNIIATDYSYSQLVNVAMTEMASMVHDVHDDYSYPQLEIQP